MHHLSCINFSWKGQHAFIKNKSTFTNLLITYSSVINAIDSGALVDVVYIDCTAAFDSISYSVLIDRLGSIGINTYILRWISNYLTDRNYSVKIGSSYSDLFSITNGVPQGSALGPILFNLYIHNILMTNLHPNTFVIAYADDIKLYRKITCDQDCLFLQQDLDTIVDNLTAINLSVNLKKTCFIRFGHSHHPLFSYNILGSSITNTDMTRDLGVIVTNDLSWTSHTLNQISKASKILAWYWRILPMRDVNLFSKIYKIYIQCHTDYASSLVYPVFKKDRILIDRPLRKFSKYIGTLSTLSFSKRLFALNLWDHKIRTIYRDMVDVFKILNNVYDMDNYQIFKLSHNYSTRGHTKKLYKEKFRLTNTNLFFTYRVINFWNSLPSDIVGCGNIAGFKARLRIFLTNYDGDFFDYN